MFGQSDKDLEARASSEEVNEQYSSFDDLAIGLAEGTLTRGRALKCMGVALLGGLGAMAGLGTLATEADAKKRRRKKKGGANKGGAKQKNCPGGTTKCVGANGLIYCCPGSGINVCNLLDLNISLCLTL